MRLILIQTADYQICRNNGSIIPNWQPLAWKPRTSFISASAHVDLANFPSTSKRSCKYRSGVASPGDARATGRQLQRAQRL